MHYTHLRSLCLLLALTAVSAPISLAPAALAQSDQLTAVQAVAVIDLTPKGDASANAAGAVTDRVRSLVVQSGLFQVMEREAMDKIMREQGFQSSQDCTGEACVQIGRLLSVKRMVTGSLMQLGSSYTVNLRMIDTESGTILREEFIDCDCSIESLTRDKLPWLVAKLLGKAAPSPTQATPSPDTRPVRVARPWLLYATAGNIHAGLIQGQFNFNEYFAVHGGGGFGHPYAGGMYPPGVPGMASGMALAGAKVYFNPHDIAGFADVTYGTTNWIEAVLGAEYRHPMGLTFTASGGLGFSIRTVSPHWLMNGGVGFAF